MRKDRLAAGLLRCIQPEDHFFHILSRPLLRMLKPVFMIWRSIWAMRLSVFFFAAASSFCFFFSSSAFSFSSLAFSASRAAHIVQILKCGLVVHGLVVL